MIFGLARTLAIPSGFGRSRIRRNCGYTLLCVGFLFPFSFIVSPNKIPTIIAGIIPYSKKHTF